jgi:hypothetical protein
MSGRRVINGQTYIQIRSGGWRLVMNGYIRTRRGWRKLRRAGQGARRRSAHAAVPVAMLITETVAPSIIGQPAAESPRHRQWGGKYDTLQAKHEEGVTSLAILPAPAAGRR